MQVYKWKESSFPENFNLLHRIGKIGNYSKTGYSYTCVKTYKAVEEYVKIEEQELQTLERKGFTVVEWGGT